MATTRERMKLPNREERSETRNQPSQPVAAPRPRVNGILRNLAIMCTAYLLVVIVALILGDTLGIQDVDPWVKTFAVTSSAFAGFFTLVVLGVYDNV